MTTDFEKQKFKTDFINYAKNEPSFLLELFDEAEKEINDARKKHLESIVREDFAEYEPVFKALA